MTKEELEAIRERFEAARLHFREMNLVGVSEDVDALLAEVERLRAKLAARPVLLMCEHGADGQVFASPTPGAFQELEKVGRLKPGMIVPNGPTMTVQPHENDCSCVICTAARRGEFVFERIGEERLEDGMRALQGLSDDPLARAEGLALIVDPRGAKR